MNLAEAVALVVADVRESYPDVDAAYACAHARNVVCCVECLDDDGGLLAVAYAEVLTADPADLLSAAAHVG